jgi:hypothetical protein
VVGFAVHAYVSVIGSSDENVPTNDGVDTQEERVATTTDGVETGEGNIDNQDYTFNAVPNNTSGGGYMLSVSDQAAGGAVYVSQMSLMSPSWVAVREDVDGQLGNILGAGWYADGSQNGTIELLRETEADNIYYAVIYQDNGDKEFDYNTDHLVKDVEGSILVTKFRTY